ncbi:hypothetical protein NDU88_004563 [Pleurodeles waltl]|uniref:Uncharacterized protein n=1 Tax=Pleurodeles waltl TaxID=8319 RepID=A0AAV7SJA7_PLEWA|nr:hypothetical protein NDU88_004563 [Pleurodeles waltl]
MARSVNYGSRRQLNLIFANPALDAFRPWHPPQVDKEPEVQVVDLEHSTMPEPEVEEDEKHFYEEKHSPFNHGFQQDPEEEVCQGRNE